MKIYSPSSATYRRVVNEAARAAIDLWLRTLRDPGRFRFEVNGIECLLEFHEGHWGFVGEGRWRWGRVDAGDPDEDLSGENVLLEVALGHSLPPRPMSTARRFRDFPVYGTDTELTVEEIEQRAAAAATENLHKLTLHRLPRI